MRWNQRFASGMALALMIGGLALALGGCAAWNKKADDAKEVAGAPKGAAAKPSDIDEIQMQKIREKDPYLRSQVDVEFSARWVEPGLMEVLIMNKTDKPLEVGPENFRIILPPNHHQIRTKPESKKLFPTLTLQPKGQASGQLKFPSAPPGAETRLVFFHPNAKQAMAQVK